MVYGSWFMIYGSGSKNRVYSFRVSEFSISWFMEYDLWYRFIIHGSWSRNKGLGFRVLEFMVYGLWFMIHDLWFRVKKQGLEF
jgi:hypothetical protein